MLLLRNNIYTNFLKYKGEYDGLWGFEEQILKKNTRKVLKLLFLKSRYQFISKNLTIYSGYVGYLFIDSNSKLGPSFIAKLSVSEKNSYGCEYIFVSFTHKKFCTFNTRTATRRVIQLQRVFGEQLTKHFTLHSSC